jgi:hypothetical protein
MTQHGSHASSKHRRHPSSPQTDAPNADDVDTSMEFMKVPMLQALDDRNPTEPDLKQLPPRHHPMLPRRQLGDRLVLGASGRFDINGALI